MAVHSEIYCIILNLMFLPGSGLVGNKEGTMKRWRKQPNAIGLASACQSPRGYELREGQEIIAWVSPLTRDRFEVIGWYWYGFGQNTCDTPTDTADKAKAGVMAWIKRHGI